MCQFIDMKVRKRAKIRNQYNQAPHLTQDTNGKVTTSQLNITNESQEVSPFPAGDPSGMYIAFEANAMFMYKYSCKMNLSYQPKKQKSSPWNKWLTILKWT